MLPAKARALLTIIEPSEIKVGNPRFAPQTPTFSSIEEIVTK
jgi:hypothetical protein